MTDEDVVRRCQEIAGCGTLWPLPKKAERYKQPWKWQVSRRNDVEELIYVLLPFLGERRTARALECLEIIDNLNAKYGRPNRAIWTRKSKEVLNA